ncbi:hypothetical protein ACRAWB_04910 [Leifsonia poae]|uniref:hypothetical protein n=1 Tax=Leifsonia poae TaxID=110933 RepID=UPI003D694A31
MLDVWGVREFRDPAMWASDRVHLSTRGHRLLAAQAAHALGVPFAQIGGPEPSVPPDDPPAPPDAVPLRTWLRVYAIPWVARRLRHVSTGDGRGPKLPVPRTVGGPH